MNTCSVTDRLTACQPAENARCFCLETRSGFLLFEDFFFRKNYDYFHCNYPANFPHFSFIVFFLSTFHLEKILNIDKVERMG